MGQPIRIDFGTQSHPGRLGPDTGPRHINTMVEQVVEGQPPLPIYATPGLTLRATITDGGTCRGMIEVGDKLGIVSGQKLVLMDTNWAISDIGGIPGATNVFMARNAKASTAQVAIVLDGNKYVLENNVLSDITDTDLPPPGSVTFSDQRAIYTIRDGRLFWSDIDDLTSIGALSFATAEGAPDGLVRGYGHRLDTWLFGSKTTEIWRATSSTTNPFQRVGGGFLTRGCSAEHSVASLGEIIFWVGDDNVPYMAPGYQLQPLNHPPVVRDLESITNRESIIGWTYSLGGHGFYVLTSDEWTWQYHIGVGWIERKSLNSDRWRIQLGSPFNNYTVVSDNLGNVYTLNASAHDENSNDMVWTVRSAPMHAFPNRISVDRFYADFITGVGINSSDTDKSVPQVGLRYSDDGGLSWSRQRLRSLGEMGHREVRVVWDGLGITGRMGRIWELESSAAVSRGLRYVAIEGDQVGT